MLGSIVAHVFLFIPLKISIQKTSSSNSTWKTGWKSRGSLYVIWNDLPLSSRIIHMAQGGQNSVSTGGQFSVDISIQEGNHYGPVSVGTPNEEVRDECIQYGKMIGALVRRLG